MSFDPTTLECFIAVAQTRSFTNAAHKVFRTQSAVSQKISKLEQYIGKLLFVRGRKLILTADGEIFLSYARKIIELNHEAMDRFRNPELEGDVRFGLPEDFATIFLSEILTTYATLHPRIHLNVECDLTLTLFERFKRKEFDLVLLKMNRPEDFPNGIDVWSETLEWVGKSDFFNSDDRPVSLVLSPDPCVYRARAIKALERMNKKWRIVFSSPSYAGTLAAVRAGMGITVLARNMIPEDLQIIRTENNLPGLEDTHISLLKHDNKSLAVNSFEEFVMQRLRL